MTPIGEDTGKNLHVVVHFITGKVLTVYCDHLKALKSGMKLTLDAQNRYIFLPYSSVLFYDTREPIESPDGGAP